MSSAGSQWSSRRLLVPWRSDEGGWRDQLWRFTRERWRTAFPGLDVVEGESPEGPFNRSAAINDAASLGEWETAIVIDADVVIDPAQVLAGIAMSEHYNVVTLPYTRFMGLTPHMTNRVLAEEESGWDRGVRYRSDEHESSCVIIPRSVWDVVGGFDEAFIGWGQEDVAFMQAVRVLIGEPRRIGGNVYHLWHPRAEERNNRSRDWQENQKLGDRYRAATTPDAIRRLQEGTSVRSGITV